MMSLTSLKREIGCWPWDVCAGVVIAEEAGGLVSGSHSMFALTSETESFGIVTEELLTGRKYIVVRAIADTVVRSFVLPPIILALNNSTCSQDEKGIDAQKRIIKEFYESVQDVDTV